MFDDCGVPFLLVVEALESREYPVWGQHGRAAGAWKGQRITSRKWQSQGVKKTP